MKYPSFSSGWTRRTFLRASAGAVAAAGAAPLFGALPAASRRVKVPAHVWVYAAPLPQHDVTPVLDRIFADMKYAGLDGVEFMQHPFRDDRTTERIAALSREYDLPVIGTSYEADMWDRAQREAIVRDARRVITNLAKVGGRTLGTSVGFTDGPKTPEQLDAQAEVVRELMAFGADHGVVLNLHNHTYEVENDMHDLRGTLERVPDVKLGPDLNWLVRAGVDPVWFIDTYGDRIVYLHLRDQHADGRWSEAIGEGDMDFRAIGEALRRVNFSGDAAVELAHERDFEPTRPIRESLKISRAFVRDTLGY